MEPDTNFVRGPSGPPTKGAMFWRWPQGQPRAIARIRAVFFLHALASGGLYPRLPAIQAGIGLDDSGLGLVLLGFALGTIVTVFFASSMIERAGTRIILLVGIPALGVGTALLAVMPSAPILFAAFVVYGTLYGLTNIAMNIEADRSKMPLAVG